MKVSRKRSRTPALSPAQRSGGVGGALGRSLAAAVVLALANAGSIAQERAGAGKCTEEAGFTASVAAVADGRTFTLANGHEVRLAAIETPVPPLSSSTTPQNRAEAAPERPVQTPVPQAATAALSALVSGATIALRPLTPATDRYGRLLARAFVTRDGIPLSVEAELVARGHAYVAPRAGEPACTAALSAAEARARAGKLGLWGDPYYETKQADEPAAVLAARGRFAVVEGKVVSVRESGGTIYVNFGRRWSEDFTVTVSKRNERNFAAAGMAPKTLAGHRVRVRGWVEERGGPWIEATSPTQIETVDGR